MNLFKKMDITFDRYDETIRNYLSKTLNNLGLQYSHSQLFGIIFDGIKGIMQNMLFYIEDALSEQNIFTALRKKSIYSLAKVSGYDAYYGSSATGILLATLHLNNALENKTTKVFIRNRSRVWNKKTGVQYSIILPNDEYVVDISKPLMTHELTIVQGYFGKSTYVASGVEMETVHVFSQELFDKQYISVIVDGEKWTECANFYDMSENGHEYILSIGYDNAFDIIFGNGVYGKKIEEGQSVIVEYLRHSGTMGNIMPSDIAEFKFYDFCYDVFGNSIDGNMYIDLSMSSCISGGTNSDSIAFIKSMVGANSRSLVLASPESFKLFFRRFSFVGYVNCWSETNSMYINTICMKDISNEVKTIEDYFNMPVENMILTYDQKQMILNTLNNSNKTFAGMTVRFEDPVIRKFAFICYVKADNIYSRDTITTVIRKTLGEYFMNVDNDKKFISKSELIKILMNSCKQILSIDITIVSEIGESYFHNKYYYKKELQLVNNEFVYIDKKVNYEENLYPGLDIFGNISLDSNIEIPVLKGGFNYYINKNLNAGIGNSENDYIKINDIQTYFI